MCLECKEACLQTTLDQFLLLKVYFFISKEIIYATQFSGLHTEPKGKKQSIDPIPIPALVLILSIFAHL